MWSRSPRWKPHPYSSPLCRTRVSLFSIIQQMFIQTTIGTWQYVLCSFSTKHINVIVSFTRLEQKLANGIRLKIIVLLSYCVHRCQMWLLRSFWSLSDTDLQCTVFLLYGLYKLYIRISKNSTGFCLVWSWSNQWPISWHIYFLVFNLSTNMEMFLGRHATSCKEKQMIKGYKNNWKSGEKSNIDYIYNISMIHFLCCYYF